MFSKYIWVYKEENGEKPQVKWMIIKRMYAIGLMSRVFANVPADRGSIQGRVIPKTQKIVLDADLLSTKR